jgi:hypothetical protein
VGLKIIAGKMQEKSKATKPGDLNWQQEFKPLLSPVHLLMLIFFICSYK